MAFKLNLPFLDFINPLHKRTAEYGEQVVIELAKDPGASETELKYMIPLARTSPIPPAPDK